MRVSSWLYLLEQSLCSICLFYAIGKCAGLKRMNLRRIILVSVALAFASMLCTARSPWQRLPLLVLAAFTPLFVWPDAPVRFRFRLMALTPFAPLWLTGLLRLLHPLALPGVMALLLGCASLAAMPLFFRSASPLPAVTSIEVRIGPRRLTLTALIDSGNLLRDVITGLPVIVISRQAAARLLSLPPEGTLLPGMRLMNVRTISGTAMMTILHPDGLRLLSGHEWQETAALIGLSPDGYEGFQALLPACLLHDSAAIHTHQPLSQGG